MSEREDFEVTVTGEKVTILARKDGRLEVHCFTELQHPPKHLDVKKGVVSPAQFCCSLKYCFTKKPIALLQRTERLPVGCRVETRSEEVYSQPGRPGKESKHDSRVEVLPKEFLEAMTEKLVSFKSEM